MVKINFKEVFDKCTNGNIKYRTFLDGSRVFCTYKDLDMEKFWSLVNKDIAFNQKQCIKLIKESIKANDLEFIKNKKDLPSFVKQVKDFLTTEYGCQNIAYNIDSDNVYYKEKICNSKSLNTNKDLPILYEDTVWTISFGMVNKKPVVDFAVWCSMVNPQ